MATPMLRHVVGLRAERPTMRRRWPTPTVVLVAGLLGHPAFALHTAAPSAVRLTSDASHVHPSTRSWGDLFAFASRVDLSGTNDGTGAQQIFVFRLADYACRFGRADLLSAGDPTCPAVPRPYLIQATAGGGSPDNPSVNDPDVNGDGVVVAFDADGSFGQSGGPAASRRQVFVKNLKSRVLTKVTDAPDGDSVRPSLNAGGGLVVFESTAPLLGGAAGVSQIFAYHVASGLLTQITNGAAPSQLPMANKLGDHVAFQSRADLLGTGADTGVWQIFWFDRTSGTLHQLTRGNGSSRHPYVQEKAPGLVFFDSEATNLPGTSAGPGTQIYAVSSRDGDLPVVFQYTYGPGNAMYPAVEPNGNRVLFVSDGDLLRNDTSGWRLFSLDFSNAANVLFQITGRGTVSGPIGASFGTWFATIATTDDCAGTGVCGQQLYVLNYNTDHYYEPGHARTAATALGSAPLEPPPGNANTSCDDGNPCSADACRDGTSCVHAARPDGTACATGTLCTGVPVCDDGRCVARGGLDCDDADPCTADACNASTGECEHSARCPATPCRAGSTSSARRPRT